MFNFAAFDHTSHSPSLTEIVEAEQAQRIVDFCFITNPYFPPKQFVKKMQMALPRLVKQYPASNQNVLQHTVAQYLQTSAKNIVAGNGSSELISILLKHSQYSLAVPIPTFSEYIEQIPNKNQLHLFQLPKNEDYKLCVDDYVHFIRQHQAQAALIINPGNPTGQLLPLSEMLRFAEACKHLHYIIVDESFIDFSAVEIPSIVPYIEQYKNLVIIRSLSKHCGIPGLRLGCACTGNQEILQLFSNYFLHDQPLHCPNEYHIQTLLQPHFWDDKYVTKHNHNLHQL